MNQEELYTFKESIFLIIGVIGALIYKLLGWIMPKTYDVFFNHFKNLITQDVNDELKEIKNMLQGYKSEKHNLEGENESLKQAINDAESLEELKKIIKNNDDIF